MPSNLSIHFLPIIIKLSNIIIILLLFNSFRSSNPSAQAFSFRKIRIRNLPPRYVTLSLFHTQFSRYDSADRVWHLGRTWHGRVLREFSILKLEADGGGGGRGGRGKSGYRGESRPPSNPYPTFELLVARISRKKSGRGGRRGVGYPLNCERNGNAENWNDVTARDENWEIGNIRFGREEILN